MTVDWQGVSWPKASLDRAVLELVRAAKLCSAPEAAQLRAPAENEDVGDWLVRAASGLGSTRFRSIDCGSAEIREVLEGCAPAILAIELDEGCRYVVALSSTSRRLRVLTETLEVVGVSLTEIGDLKLRSAADAHTPLVNRCLTAMRPLRYWRPALARRQRLWTVLMPRRKVEGLWLLELDTSAPFKQQLRRSRVHSRIAGAGVLAVLEVASLAGSWVLIGESAIRGVVQESFMGAWAILLLSAALVGAGLRALGDRALCDTNCLLRARLFSGALRLPADQIRRQGSGKLLATVQEADLLGNVGLTGAFNLGIASVHLLSALAVATLGAMPVLQPALLLAWIAGFALLIASYVRARMRWARRRFDSSQLALEHVVGHRTRVTQQLRSRWHELEDHATRAYQVAAEQMDRLGRIISVVPGRGWLCLGLLSTTPALLSGDAEPVAMAIALGGMLQAYGALTAIASQVVPVANALVAWRQVREMYDSGTVRPEPGNPVALAALSRQAGSQHPTKSELLSVRRVGYQYDEGQVPVLSDCSLSIFDGDRVLLYGASGGGKSTFASLLAGLRFPRSGQILLKGFDRPSIGVEAWRRRVVLVPQFHENHLLGTTLAYNLLMGTTWPPTDGDLKEAERVCRELGLEKLLENMPQGLNQIVGETGWQLSHGERARVFLARALLQRPDVLILDESFGAIDPKTLSRVFDTVSRRAPTLVAIAHP